MYMVVNGEDGKQMIELACENITHEVVDAIVTPANTGKEGAGGVASALRMQGYDPIEGDVITRELNEYRKKHGPLYNQVAVTSGS